MWDLCSFGYPWFYIIFSISGPTAKSASCSEAGSGSGSNHQSEYEGKNQCWEPVSDAIHPSLKLIIIRWLPITRGPDIEGHVSWLWGTCPRVGPLPMRELITGPLWVKWAPVIITPRINLGSRVAIDTFYRCLNITIMCHEREKVSHSYSL